MLRRLLYILLVIYAIWGFVCSKTVYGSPMAVYTCFSILFVLFFYFFLKTKKARVDTVAWLWIPYIFVTACGSLLEGSMEMMVYWIIALILVLTNRSKNFEEDFPYKCLYYCGVVSLFGIIVQIALPHFYNSYIKGIFTNTDQLESWSEVGYGFAGFTYQLAATATPILYAIPVTLFAGGKVMKYSEKKWLRITIAALLIVGVFLTGKRILALCAVTLPVVISLLTSRKLNTKVLWVFMACIAAGVGLSYFINHAYEYLDNPTLRRFAESIIELSMGEDVTSGRTDLYDLAIKAFYDHPIFGIGVGQYIPYTNAYTSTHNTYLQVLCEQGIIGITLYVIPLFISLLKTIKLARIYRTPSLKISLFIQMLFICYAMTGNVNSEFGTFGIYFLSLGFLQNSLNSRIY